MKFIIAFGALAVLTTAQAQFSRMELTKEDSIDLYAVPVRDQPAFRFEWKVASPTTFRLAVEFKRNGDDKWQVQQSSDRTADESVSVMFVRHDRPQLRTTDGRYILPVRWGSKNKAFSGWASFDAVLADVGDDVAVEIRYNDPENLVLIQGRTGIYRLSLRQVSKS